MAQNQTMTFRNLKAYMTWRGKPWEVDHILYERLPMLAVRNYLSNDAGDEWPLCWAKGRPISLGLSTCMEALKGWQAFRSVHPGVAKRTRMRLQACVPPIVEQLQIWLREHRIYRLHDAKGRMRESLIRKMAETVAKVSDCKRLKKSNPMLGSKVMHFFFPELFPVWDTAWIKRTIRALRIEVDGKWVSKFHGRDALAAVAYAQYLDLMFNDLELGQGRVDKLKRTMVSFSARRNKHWSLGAVVDDNFGDLTPILFELCLMGRGHACGVL